MISTVKKSDNPIYLASPNQVPIFFKRVGKYKILFLMLVPALVYYIIFHYFPMYGVIVAFKDFSFSKGILGSDWAGLKYFRKVFSSSFFWRALKNTVIISIYRLVFEFPAPILFALVLNEIRSKHFKKGVQTLSYLPHFLSWVVVAGVLYNFLNRSSGILNIVLKAFDQEPIIFMMQSKYFRSILIISDLWKTIGWSSIIYIATISTLDISLYESASIDGAKRWQKAIYVTIPGITSVIVILLILRIGSILYAGFDQIFVLYNPLVYEVADILDTYVYREGLLNMQWSFSTAVGLFKSVIGLILLYVADRFAKYVGETGIL